MEGCLADAKGYRSPTASSPGPNCGELFTAEIAEIILEASWTRRRMPIVKRTIHLDRSPDDFVSNLIHPVHLCALGGLSGE